MNVVTFTLRLLITFTIFSFIFLYYLLLVNMVNMIYDIYHVRKKHGGIYLENLRLPYSSQCFLGKYGKLSVFHFTFTVHGPRSGNFTAEPANFSVFGIYGGDLA